MSDTRSGRRMALAAAMLSLGLAACGHYEPRERTVLDDVPPGPGLFTGKAGTFYLVGGSPEPDTNAGKSDEPGAKLGKGDEGNYGSE